MTTLVRDMPASGLIRQPTNAFAWKTIAFLFAFMLINYADRGVLGLAAEPLMKDLGLTPTQFGSIGSAFFLFYSLSAVTMGFVLNRVETRWMLFVLVIVWSIAQFPMLAYANFSVLLASRMLLGAGEGPAYPAAIHCAFKWFPDERRTLPTSFITQGSAVGVIVAAPVMNWIIIRYGWQIAFGALGVIGAIWALAWARFAKEGPIAVTVTAAGSRIEKVPYRRLLLNPTILATWFTVFAAFWTLALLLVWFPSYLRTGLGFSRESIGIWSAVPWAGGALVVILVGWMSQRLIMAGHSSRVSRVIFVCIGGCIGGACLLALPLVDSTAVKLVLVCLGVVLPNAMFAPAQAIQGELSPVPQRGAVLAIGNAVASTAGMFAPLVTGMLVQHAASPLAGYENAFAVCGLVVGAANLLGLLLIRPESQAAQFAARADVAST